MEELKKRKRVETLQEQRDKMICHENKNTNDPL